VEAAPAGRGAARYTRIAMDVFDFCAYTLAGVCNLQR